MRFVKWADEYRNAYSKAVMCCEIDGNEWASSINNLVNKKSGCTLCAIKSTKDKQRRPKNDAEDMLNSLPNLRFVRWATGYENAHSKAVMCCEIDGHQWSTTANSLLDNKTGCQECRKRKLSMSQRTPLAKVERRLNSLQTSEFVKWQTPYKNHRSRVVLKCRIDGYEWTTSISHIFSGDRGCPKCASYGFNPGKPGVLYVLRSSCGEHIKVGISNKLSQRLSQLRNRTPFDFTLVGVVRRSHGFEVAAYERAIHSRFDRSGLEGFDGCTEWLKFDKAILEEVRQTEGWADIMPNACN